MGAGGKLFKALLDAVRLSERVETLSHTVAEQRQRIDTLTERVIRLEATLDLVVRMGARRIE